MFTVLRDGYDFSLTNNTELVAYTSLRIEDAEAIFGPPTDDCIGDKIDTEWVIQFNDPKAGLVTFTLYDWKGSQTLHVGARSEHKQAVIRFLDGLARFTVTPF